MSSKTSSAFSEDWLPIKSINNGVIVLNNNQKVTGVKIQPKNIFILEPSAQASVINSLKSMYDTLDFEFWIISNDRPVDISGYLAALQIQYNQAQDTHIKKLLIQDIDKANDFMHDNVTDVEYFILFKEKNDDFIQKRLRTIIMGLSSCGLNCNQVSNNDLRAILDGFFNGGMTTDSKVVLPDER